MTTDYKNIIIAELEVLRQTSATEEGGVFKSRSYASAIKALKALPHVRTMDDLPAASQKGNGIGPKIREKIAHIIVTGGLTISTEKREAADALEAFCGIYGVGPKKAEELIRAGYKTIADLRASLPTSPKLLNRAQLIGLMYYEHILARIPRTEMDQHAAMLMGAIPDNLEGVIVGSYRRGQPDSGDIDMLVRVKNPAEVPRLEQYVDLLRERGYIREVLAMGTHKCLAIAQVPGSAVARRLDLLITPPAQFPFAVFYFTGCDTFNVRVRQHALTMGLTLNEHALTSTKTGAPVEGLKSEREIFEHLRIEWREPHERTGPAAVVLKKLTNHAPPLDPTNAS